MIGTREKLRLILNHFYPQWRVIERHKLHRVDVYAHGYVNSSVMAEIDLMRPAGIEIRFYKMGFLQSLFFGRRSWSVQ